MLSVYLLILSLNYGDEMCYLYFVILCTGFHLKIILNKNKQVIKKSGTLCCNLALLKYKKWNLCRVSLEVHSFPKVSHGYGKKLCED